MKLNKDFEFSLKLMVLIALVAFLAFDFVLQLYAPKKNLEGIPTLERLDVYYAFFTTQTNYAVVFYLIAALFMRRIYNKKPVFGIELAMTVYITITMLVFWTGLFASSDELGSYYLPNWVSTIILHVLIPIIMIGYFLLSCGDKYYSPSVHTKFSLPLTCSYPVAYLVFSLIRGEIRFRFYSPEFFTKIYSSDFTSWFWTNSWNFENGVIDATQRFTPQMWYPYWFLNVHQYTLQDQNQIIYSQNLIAQWLLILSLCLSCIALTILVVGLQFVYLVWNNKKFYRWHDIQGNLITKEEHDYRLQKAKLRRVTAKNEARMFALHRRTEARIFLNSLSSLPKSEKKEKKRKFYRARALHKKLKSAAIQKRRMLAKVNRKQIKRFILTLNYKDRSFVRENLRKAERYKKLVKKGVLIFKPKYVS